MITYTHEDNLMFKILNTVVIFAIGFTLTDVPDKNPNLHQVRSKAEYESELKDLTKFLGNFSNEDFYKNYNFVHKKTGEKKKFSDFDELHKKIFYLMQIEKLTFKLENLKKQWQKELDFIDPTVDDPAIAKKDDIEKYIQQISILREKTARDYEDFIHGLFKKFPDDFTEDEKKYILKKVTSYHDKNKLIERADE